jgi:flagellar P-ring protein precursor FlgI
VQDIARLQGQRVNKLMGYGLVVGLDGTGDGGKNRRTARALAALHRRFHQPIFEAADLRDDNNVAVAMVEVTIPEYGAREGQALDVVVSALAAKSIQGGQLLNTPLQFVMFDQNDPSTQTIFALAGGRIDLTDEDQPTRGVIRGGAVLEEDFFYSFIDGDAVTLVLDDAHAGFPFTQMVARAINHDLANPADAADGAAATLAADVAEAVGPKNVVVRIPNYELPRPAAFLSRVLQTPLFELPQPPARVLINRTTKNVSFTGTVRISPTVLQIPGLGTVTIGATGAADTGAVGVVGLDTEKAGGVEFQQLLDTLGKVKLTGKQTVEAIEHLHRTGTLHAQLIYTE